MKITKYEHACFVAEENGQSLVVDPGNWTSSFTAPDNVVAVVITHEHQDHLDLSHLHAIVSKNPEVVIITHPDVVKQLTDFNARPANPGDSLSVGGFNLTFYGGDHAVISPDRPALANIGVMINDRVYYPGDSFAIPDAPVDILALPVSAPWMKYSEAMEFLTAVKPRIVFPTHDAILSDVGKGLADAMSSAVANQTGAAYQRLQVGVVTEL